MSPTEAERVEIQLLSAQLGRMRGMLYGYSDLFFRRIRDWALVAIGLLVLAIGDVVPDAVILIPFVVPFAFLETAYLFWYTVFARRYAERLERRLNELASAEVLIAHRLEAAYFHPPDAPRVAAFSFGNPLGMMSMATVGYTVGAGLLWIAGLAGAMERTPVAVVIAAIAWTLGIAVYLVWSSLARRDEARLVRELDRWEESRRPS